MTARATHYRFTADTDMHGNPLEYLATIPARDLDDADTSALDEAQWALLESDTGGRIYDPVPMRTGGDLPKWYQGYRDKAARDGAEIPALLEAETQAAYDERTRPAEPEVTATDVDQEIAGNPLVNADPTD